MISPCRFGTFHRDCGPAWCATLPYDAALLYVPRHVLIDRAGPPGLRAEGEAQAGEGRCPWYRPVPSWKESSAAFGLPAPPNSRPSLSSEEQGVRGALPAVLDPPHGPGDVLIR